MNLILPKARLQDVLLLFVPLVAVLIYAGIQNFLLFHSLIEISTITIAFSFFIITWLTKHLIENKYLVFIGISFLFVGIIDLFHLLSYKGIDIFHNYDFATQFWIIARYMQSISLIVGFYFLKKEKIKVMRIFLIYMIISLLFILSVVEWEIFPAGLTEDGLTLFKIVSEYIIILFLCIAIFLIHQNRHRFTNHVYSYFIYSLVLSVFSEFSFTAYIRVYDLVNIMGHFFKLFAFYLFYKAIVETAIKQPFELLFMEIKNREGQLKEINEMKDRFFSIIAHDLRNPFNGIISIAEFVKLKMDQKDYENAEKLLEHLNAAAKKGYNLLEDLLQWSKIQMNRISIESKELNISDLVDELASLLNPSLKEKNLTFKNHAYPDEIVYADPNMVKTILRNLISNAIKFTPEQGSIIINTEKSNGDVNIKVTDTGIGMPPSIVDSLFKVDQSMNYMRSGTNKEKGTGFGLVLCKEFAEKNRGSISVNSEEGKGSTFILSLPNK